jgi:hypothetical protein
MCPQNSSQKIFNYISRVHELTGEVYGCWVLVHEYIKSGTCTVAA